MMIQTLNRRPTLKAEKIICCYCNNTRHIQVARIENIPSWHFERMFFPSDCLMFEAFPHAWLEIYTGELCHALLSERILCDRLQATPHPSP